MLNLTAGGLSGGYRKYLTRLIPMLRAEGTITELLSVVPPGHEQLPGIEGEVWSWRSGEHVRGYPELRKRVRAWNAGVVFIPTARYINCQAPTLVMVQNMLPMLPPTVRDGLSAWAKLRIDATLARRATASATRVIAVSNYVRDFLVERWNVPANKLGVVYHGVDKASPRDHHSSPTALPADPFLFTAGSLFPYRGLEDAIEALTRTTTPIKLVIAGEGSVGYHARMVNLARSLGVADRVVWLGQIPPDLMTVAYQQCAAFLMTSRVEACPNIALEAMASGAWCISTSCEPMPEFFHKHALYYTPNDSAALAAQINAVVGAPLADLTRHRLDAQHRAEAFTWENTLRGVVRELKQTQEDRA